METVGKFSPGPGLVVGATAEDQDYINIQGYIS
jgi:hypothetical protein